MVEGETHVRLCILIKTFSLLRVDKICEKFHDFSVRNAPSYRLAGRNSIFNRVPEFFLNIYPASFIIGREVSFFLEV
jgi:hypothetical protein